MSAAPSASKHRTDTVSVHPASNAARRVCVGAAVPGSEDAAPLKGQNSLQATREQMGPPVHAAGAA